MSEKPQVAQNDEQDILERIIAQRLEKMKSPAQTAAAEETLADETDPAPRQEASDGTAPPAGAKSRRSAVYLYLLILFSAAFLMLLLAYFIQRRSNESTISDLRDSMNLSREELLDEIRALEMENEALNEELDRLKDDRQAYEEQLQEEIKLWSQDYAVAQEYLYSWNSFWELERYYQTGDLQSCAAVLILQGQSQYSYHAPDAARQEEILQAVIDRGILDEDYYWYPDSYNDLLVAYFDKIGVSIETVQRPDTVQWSVAMDG